MGRRAGLGGLMRRGDVRWYKFPRPDKRRPVLILTRTSALEYLGEVTVAPITSTIREIPSEVVLTPEDGMPKECAVNLDHLQTVSKGRIGPLITSLSSQKMAELRRALLFALGFERLS
ncbi:MAG: type II toxin-antitoxin system PemK/MazF family toxin [Thermoanaerobaculia bacterium]